MGVRFAVTLVAGLALLVASPAVGTVLDVPSAAYPTIQSAIDAAVDGDTVQVAAGTYFERLSWQRKSISLLGAGAESTVVDAAGSGRCLSMFSVPDGARIQGFTFTGGWADGGGMYLYASSPTIVNTVVAGNGAPRSGGGMYLYSSSPTLEGNTIADNSAAIGGGLCIWYSSPRLANNVIVRNSASDGGGMYLYASTPTLTNNTIVENSGGGLANAGSLFRAAGAPQITNCILWGNVGGPDLVGASATHSDVGSGEVGGPGNISADPMFVGAGDYHLQGASPCVDRGDSGAPGLPATDKDGNPRVAGAAADMGAYEQAASNQPPVADAGPDQTVEQTTYDGAMVTLDGTASYDPDGDELAYEWDVDADGQFDDALGPTPEVVLNLGAHEIALRVTDPAGLSDVDTVTVDVADSTPPEIALTVTEDPLWPPNHELHLCATVVVTDLCDPDPTVAINVSCNQPVNGPGDGNTEPDWDVVWNDDLGEWEIWLRAERAGRGSDRAYSIDVNATDASGNPAAASAEIKVAHDQGKKKGKK